MDTPVVGDNFILLIKKLGSANENNVKIYLYGDKVIESDKIA